MKVSRDQLGFREIYKVHTKGGKDKKKFIIECIILMFKLSHLFLITIEPQNDYGF